MKRLLGALCRHSFLWLCGLVDPHLHTIPISPDQFGTGSCFKSWYATVQCSVLNSFIETKTFSLFIQLFIYNRLFDLLVFFLWTPSKFVRNYVRVFCSQSDLFLVSHLLGLNYFNRTHFCHLSKFTRELNLEPPV